MAYQSLSVRKRVQVAQKLFKDMELPGIDGKSHRPRNVFMKQ